MAAADTSGMTNPRTGRIWKAKNKKKRACGGKRNEVFDDQFTHGEHERGRRTEAIFDESAVLLVGKIGIDPERVSAKIAAFDMDETLIKPK